MARTMARAWAVLVLVLGLSGCAAFGPGSGVFGHPDVDRFELSGRIAVRYGDDGYSGTLRWRHVAARDVVELYSPIGTLYARLTRDAGGAVMETADGKRFEERDAAALSRRVLGWELPLDDLPYWLFTRLAPDSVPGSVETGDDGRVTSLTQGAWRVRYRSYFKEGAEPLPDRLDLDAPDLRVKMIVSRWATPA
ncbi:MAG: outer membrane lipoprotein LolB [Betaproteobacteria bacterium]|nr:outer membrane lipoprotein LolB [Betaproteobacteria bacterium]